MADNKGLDALANLGTAFGLGATDQITGKDNLGQFVAGLEKRREKADAAARNASLLDSDIALGFINIGDVKKLGGRKALEGMTAEEFALQRDNLRQAAAQEKGDENVLEEARRRVVASGNFTPEQVGSMNLDQLAEAEGAHLETLRAREHASQTVSASVDALGEELEVLRKLPPSDDVVEQANLLFDATRKGIQDNPNLHETERAVAMSGLRANFATLQAISERRLVASFQETMATNPAAALADFSTMPAHIQAAARDTETFQTLATNGKAARDLVSQVLATPDIANELDAESTALLTELAGEGDLTSAPSWEMLLHSNPKRAAQVANTDISELREGVRQAKLRVTKLRPAQADYRERLVDIQTQSGTMFKDMGLDVSSVDGIQIDSEGNITGTSAIMQEPRRRLNTGKFTLDQLELQSRAADRGMFDNIDPQYGEAVKATIRQQALAAGPHAMDMARTDADMAQFEDGEAEASTLIQRFARDLELHKEGEQAIKSTINKESSAPIASIIRRGLFDFPDAPKFGASAPGLRDSLYGSAREQEGLLDRTRTLEALILNPKTEFDKARKGVYEIELKQLTSRQLQLEARETMEFVLDDVTRILASGKFDQKAVMGVIEQRLGGAGLSQGTDASISFKARTGTAVDLEDNLNATLDFLTENLDNLLKSAQGMSQGDKARVKAEATVLFRNYAQVYELVGREIRKTGLTADDLGPDYKEETLIPQVVSTLLAKPAR